METKQKHPDVGIGQPDSKLYIEVLELMVGKSPMFAPPTEHHIKVKCHDCPEEIWVGPKLVSLSVIMCCPFCGMKRAQAARADGDEPEHVMLRNQTGAFGSH